jgi:1-aminocyclopropane-1-carboxylate deaminase
VHRLDRLTQHLGGASIWAKREDCNSGIAYGDASARPAETREQVSRIARQTAKLIGVERELADDDIHLDERYHAGTYGIPDDATLDAMRLAARTEGMVTDPVYEGKSMAALIDLVSRREIPPDATVLYAHLGGQPAINAYSALFS